MSDLDDIFEQAKNDADAAADPELQSILGQADQLAQVFDDLKLTDPATYASLKQIVQDATARNESLASVVARVEALGQAGTQLAAKISGLGASGGLAVLRSALGV